MAVVHVFSGTDSVLLDKAVRDAVKQALGDQSADFALAELSESDYQVDDGYSISPLVDAAQTPPMVLETVTGVALMGVFANSAAAALEDVGYREASGVVILTTVSGISIFGLNAAVLGLAFGGVVLFATRRLSGR